MKIEYEILESDMMDRAEILLFRKEFDYFCKSLSEYGLKLLDDGKLGEIEEGIEDLYQIWVINQHKRLKKTFDDALNCGEVNLKEEE
jgi:soluble cytochrome b562